MEYTSLCHLQAVHQELLCCQGLHCIVENVLQPEVCSLNQTPHCQELPQYSLQQHASFHVMLRKLLSMQLFKAGSSILHHLHSTVNIHVPQNNSQRCVFA